MHGEGAHASALDTPFLFSPAQESPLSWHPHTIINLFFQVIPNVITYQHSVTFPLDISRLQSLFRLLSPQKLIFKYKLQNFFSIRVNIHIISYLFQVYNMVLYNYIIYEVSEPHLAPNIGITILLSLFPMPRLSELVSTLGSVYTAALGCIAPTCIKASSTFSLQLSRPLASKGPRCCRIPRTPFAGLSDDTSSVPMMLWWFGS